MGAIMEAAFCVAYLIVTACLGVIIIRKDKLFGALTLTLVCGDAFHLVPRIYGDLSGKTGELTAAMGFGTLVTSVTMTVFYVLMYHYWRGKFGQSVHKALTYAVYILAALRIGLCAFPQNDWLTGGNLTWGIIRNAPFLILGVLIAALFRHKAHSDKYFKWAWLAITLSFAFYIPVVLFADAYPIVGMLMLPKTACYVWLVVMGLRASECRE
jgi:hypothetical protein